MDFSRFVVTDRADGITAVSWHVEGAPFKFVVVVEGGNEGAIMMQIESLSSDNDSDQNSIQVDHKPAHESFEISATNSTKESKGPPKRPPKRASTGLGPGLRVHRACGQGSTKLITPGPVAIWIKTLLQSKANLP